MYSPRESMHYGITTDPAVGVVPHYNIFGPPAPPEISEDLRIWFAGTDSVNGAYNRATLLNGRGVFTKSEHSILWTGSQWNISHLSDILYISTEDVKYPWLVSNWQIVGIGVAPAPVVSPRLYQGS